MRKNSKQFLEAGKMIKQDDMGNFVASELGRSTSELSLYSSPHAKVQDQSAIN